ncbi:MAG TPA: hypothetical protein DD477_13195 [Spirochaetaceae bacterium]|nr:MAG: hypothetical protein A2Y32_04475 [Spirochaetes bacterium GWF1_60_12]HAP44528.1 hypothetical protein [Spirochaetaceae bacterium]HBO42154.1 hypothetical protein [Spirochaetaceae bacterium]
MRTNLAGVLTLSAERPEGETINIHYNDAVGIMLPVDPVFFQAIELELRIPRALQNQGTVVAWALYQSVTPQPRSGQLDYLATSILTQPVPSRASLILQLPVMARHTLRNSPYATLIPAIAQAASFPLLFKLSPAGKAMGSLIESQIFQLTVRPILTDEGQLRLSHPLAVQLGNDAVSVFIDDRPYANWFEPHLLTRGVHTVRFSVEGYRDEVYSVVMEAGRVQTLAANPASDVPSIAFTVPDGAVIRLNGELVDLGTGQLTLEAIEYTVECTIGDYVIIRKFNAVRGRHYTLTVSVDMQIVSD